MLVSVKREGGNWTEERAWTTLGHGDSRGSKCRGKALSAAVDGQVIHLSAPFVYTSHDAQNAGPLGNVSVTDCGLAVDTFIACTMAHPLF